MTLITGCRNCGRSDLAEVLDLGQQYLSDFPRPDADGAHDRTQTWPLRLVHCGQVGCGLVQLDTTVPRELLYHDGYGFYSGVNETIRADLADIVQHARYYRPDPDAWLDIACNDGTLLGFVPDTCHRVGVDPVAKFAHVAQEVADNIVTGYFPDVEVAGSFDVITASSVFYDLDDPNRFIAVCADLLDDKGILIIQQNYLLAMLAANAYDNVCHEHLTYWALNPFLKLLAQHGLEALDVRVGPVNGGVFRVVAGHRGVRTPGPNVARQRYEERRRLPGMLGAFRGAVEVLVQDLRDLVGSVAAEGARIMVYGASTRGAVIWQAAGLDRAATSASSGVGSDPSAFDYRPWLEAAVERNPAKIGCRYAAVGGIPIISETEMRADPPDYLLVGPWWFRDQIIRRERAFLAGGGAFIFPLPHVEVVRR